MGPLSSFTVNLNNKMDSTLTFGSNKQVFLQGNYIKNHIKNNLQTTDQDYFVESSYADAKTKIQSIHYLIFKTLNFVKYLDNFANSNLRGIIHK